MTLALHILRKDIRRLRIPIAGLVLLVSLWVLSESTLAGAAGARGPWLTASWMAGDLLPQLFLLVYVCVLAVAAYQEPLHGARWFWRTRPYPHASLMAAKVMFALLWGHLLWLLASAVVLAGHGFSPLRYAGHLLTIQLQIAAWWTLPSLALATVSRRMSQFVISAVLLGSAAVWLASHPRVAPLAPSDWARENAVAVCLALGAAWTILCGYWMRRQAHAALWAVLTVLATGILYLGLPPQITYAAGCSATPRLSVALRYRNQASGSAIPHAGHAGYTQVGIPVQVDATLTGTFLELGFLSVSIETVTGESISVTPLPWYDFRHSERAALRGGFQQQDPNLWIELRNDLYARIAAQPVRVRGTFLAFEQRTSEARIQVDTGSRELPGFGRCQAWHRTLLGRATVMRCETAALTGTPIALSLYDAQNGQIGSFFGGAIAHWPAPLQRWQAAFLSPATPDHVQLARRQDCACDVRSFDFAAVDLARWSNGGRTE